MKNLMLTLGGDAEKVRETYGLTEQEYQEFVRLFDMDDKEMPEGLKPPINEPLNIHIWATRVAKWVKEHK